MDKRSQEEVVNKERTKRHEEFLSSDEILSSEEKRSFGGLKYFEYDERYCLKLVPTYFEQPEKEVLSVEGYGSVDLAKMAYVDFEIPTGKGRLFLYCGWGENNPKYLGAPFKDKTNGTSTYGGGRNLDLQVQADKSVVLDFNATTNLYCAYNDKFVCALPPRDNWLSIEVPVGEKKFK